MNRRALYGLWYLAISLGFALLALSTSIRGTRWWGVAIRVAIALGFAWLAWNNLRKKS